MELVKLNGSQTKPKPGIWEIDYSGEEGNDGMEDRFNKVKDRLSECNI